MQTLNNLMSKLIDNADQACNNSIPSIEVENAAALIDDYLGEVWHLLVEEDSDPWKVIMQAFSNTHAPGDEDDVVTFISYIILTQCMLKDKNK